MPIPPDPDRTLPATPRRLPTDLARTDRDPPPGGPPPTPPNDVTGIQRPDTVATNPAPDQAATGAWTLQMPAVPPEQMLRTGEFSEAHFEVDEDISPSRPAMPPVPPAPARPLPQRIAGYEIVGELGRGGMGIVYKARQLRLNRTVALKVMRGADDAHEDELARFRAEAEAVAQLSHPNIVQIYEVGEWSPPGGRPVPYCALEYVDGGTLQDDLEGKPQPPRKAAALLETLARAVHHAHEHGIVHRDLKPGNVLLSRDGTAKLTDFGLAKRLDIDQSQTGTGTVMGTPLYMAPEQAAGKVRAIGPAADIYSLGAMLYEFLCGRPPLFGETMVDTLLLVQYTDPLPVRTMMPKVPRDLETICLKCLRKEPSKRYGTAGELADDLQRFLNGEPVTARPISRVEQGLKWIRRHPTMAAVGVMAALLVVVLAGGGWAFAEQERREAARQATLRNDAEVQRRRAEEHFRLAREAVDSMLTRVGRDRLANEPRMEQIRRDLLVEALAFYDRFQQRIGDDPTLLADVARAHRTAGDIRQLLGDQAGAASAYGAARAILTRLTATTNPQPPLVKEEGQLLTALGDLNLSAGRPAEAEAAYRQASERLSTLPPDPEVNRQQLLIEISLATALTILDRLPEAQALLRTALDRSADNATPAELQSRGRALHQLGEVLSRSGQVAAAEKAYREARDIFGQLVERHPNTPDFRRELATTHNLLGTLLRDTKPIEAIKAYEAAIAIDSELVESYPDVPGFRQELATATNNLAMAHQAAGDAAAAEGHFQKAIALGERLTQEFPKITSIRRECATSLSNLAILLQQRGDLSGAEQHYRTALDRLTALLSETPDVSALVQDRISVLQNLAVLYQTLGRSAEADAVSREVLQGRRQLVEKAPDVPAYRQELARALVQRAVLRQLQGHPDDATAAYDQAITLFDRFVEEEPGTPDHAYELANALTNKAQLELAARQADSASESLQRAVGLLTPLTKKYPDRPMYIRALARTLPELASLHASRNDLTQAEAALRQAVELQTELAKRFPDGPAEHVELARTRGRLGTVLAGLGRIEPADREFSQAIEQFDAAMAGADGAIYRPELLFALANRAALFNVTGEHDLAAADWERIVAVRRDAAKGVKATPQSRAELADSLTQWSTSLRLAKKLAAAVERSQEAVALLDEASADRPPEVVDALRRAFLGLGEAELARGDVEAVGQAMGDWIEALPNDPASLVGAAGVLAGCVALVSEDNAGENYAVRAMTLLRQAIKAGVDPKALANVSSLEPLQKRPDFRKLIAGNPPAEK